MAYVQILKTPRTDIGRSIHGVPEVITLSDAITELVLFSEVNDPARIKAILGACDQIYTSFHIYEWKFE